ncbi:aminoglycoside 3'-phosphotransferase/choline kinase family protein [Bosea sp. CS1GBMeth4]|uniref:aminoglycoside phosphotransferase family protein n=1 Tax=Bosea sp. CS1GBMeth4 TaxID=1892849 RepID=UPI001648C915|nr:aminoglycoside 3'-phosphotransferase/choline kinase family protein [Bosea sp. CS1GBMeth4]
MITFPIITDTQVFANWRAKPENWQAYIKDIARSENVSADALAPYQTGTNLVVDLNGSVVLKLFPPLYRNQFVSERTTLRLLDGKLSVPIPQIIAEGDRDGWAYLIMTRLHGILGSVAWPTLAEPQKERVLREIGRTIADVQSVVPGELATIEPSWPNFITGQVVGCVERHRRQGLASGLLSDLEVLLQDVPATVPLYASPVILTGEWIPENFLLAEEQGQWRLAALIDFGDVMTGWREYDLLGPSAFMCAGLPNRVRSLLEGYGLEPKALGAEMRRRLLTLMVLHRASDLRHIYIEGWEARIGSLFDLENIIWPIEASC